VKGKTVFENRGDCLRCHAVNGRGGLAGPELGQIASTYESRYLLEALVEPQAAVAPGFGVVVLNLEDGTTVAGALMGKTETAYRVKGEGSHGEGGEILVAFEDVASSTNPLSGMPPMGQVLSLRDLRDVMAYLQTLR
jgi:putative heme-binding domain-containing protein